MISFDLDHREIERRKQLRRDLWDYRPLLNFFFFKHDRALLILYQ